MRPDAATPAHAELAPAKSRRGLKLFGVAATCTALVVAGVGIYLRWSDERALEKWTAAVAIPSVAVFHPTPITGNRTLVLPGRLDAYFAAPIYSRVSGYLQQWYVDIGAKVKAGQLLAEIETPDLDQELLQARADLASADAARSLAQITAARWQALLAKDAVSHQEADEKTGDLAAKTALANAAEAKVRQYEALSAFKRIVAPFAGVVTARKTDIGDLINAGAGTGTASELFEVSDVHKLRLYVNVPQTYSAQIHPGEIAHLTVPEHPGQSFTAQLVSSAGAVSNTSGTVLVELDVDNSAGAMQPGDYAQVTFDLPAALAARDVRIPASAVIFREIGTEVGVISADGKHARLQPITIGVDSGVSVEVVSGLSTNDRVIDNPSDSLADGDTVQVTSTEVTNAAN